MNQKRNQRLSIFCSLILLVLIACKEEQNKAIDIIGWWEQEGYGNTYEINNSMIIAYNATTVSCAQAAEIQIEAINSKYRVIKDSVFLTDGIN